MDAKFSCNIFQQDAATCIDTYCSFLIVNRAAIIIMQNALTQSQEEENDDDRNSCVKDMSTTVEEYRHAILMDYERTKEFNFIRMGIWHYKSITWLRHMAYSFSVGGSRAIEYVELCDMLQHWREEDIPIDIWQMAVDYPAHGSRPRCVIFGHHHSCIVIFFFFSLLLLSQMQRYCATSRP